MTFSIRSKLLLMAGLPIVGALILAVLIIDNATREARKAEGLGSVENVAELSERITTLGHALQAERAATALDMGRRHRATARREIPKVDGNLKDRRRDTKAASDSLRSFLVGRDPGRLPQRLASALAEAQTQIDALDKTRGQADAPRADLKTTLAPAGASIALLVSASAGLNELSNDGELLRVITCLVAVLELKERVSREQAIVAYAFATGDFPPGSYRDFVTLLTEQEVFESTFRTYATPDISTLYERTNGVRPSSATARLRTLALETTEGEIVADPAEWLALQQVRVDALRSVEQALNARVRATALRKMGDSQKTVWLSLLLAAAVVLGSTFTAWLISRSIARRISCLRDAAVKIGQSEGEVRIPVDTHDELGDLSHTFNEMSAELARSRLGLRDKARITRELEIAASIQRQLLPPRPKHAEFTFEGRMAPAEEVGGDFYDVLANADRDRLWLTIGDVSSHGLGAGVVMLMAQAAFSSHFQAALDAPPDEVLRSVNRTLHENIAERLKDNKYITAQLLVYRSEGRFLSVGAHLPTLVFRHKTAICEQVETPGPWLGIMPHLVDVPLTEIDLDEGDILCLYSDGLIEARNEAGTLFDIDGLAEAVARHLVATSDLSVAADAILAEVEAYAPNREDDRTLLLVRRDRAGAGALRGRLTGPSDGSTASGRTTERRTLKGRGRSSQRDTLLAYRHSW